MLPLVRHLSQVAYTQPGNRDAPLKNWVNAIGRWRMTAEFMLPFHNQSGYCMCSAYVLCGTCRPRSQGNADGRSSITAPKRTCVHRTSLLFNEFQHIIQFSKHIPLLEAYANKEPADGRSDWPCTVNSRCRTVMISGPAIDEVHDRIIFILHMHLCEDRM